MLFSSIPFLYYFLAGVLLLYFMVPDKLKNMVLLLSSLFFYAWGEVRYVVLMILAIVMGYVFGLLIAKSRSQKQRKVFLVLAVAGSLGMLGYFKYADFFIANFNAVTGLNVPLLKVALPIGISFYTFQIMSYVVDVYRGTAKAQHNPFSLATYVSMFPQLIAGPIVRYTDVAEQLEHRVHSVDKAALGIRRFVIGLSKKILIANALGELCEIFKASGDKSMAFYWLYAIAFTLHIYYDFSGYSDMAIGLGKIFGFDFMENFNYPYISGSITEFWRRWHMSLGTWFRDYVYIPLGGNRVSRPRWLFNILVVWLLTGFWHGASWNFIVWGLYFAVLLMLEKLWLLPRLERQASTEDSKAETRTVFCLVVGLCRHIYVLLLVVISFVIFNAADMTEAFQYIGSMFGAGELPVVSVETVYYFGSYLVTLMIAVVGATPLAKNLMGRLEQTKIGSAVIGVLEPVVLIALLLLCTAFLVDGSFNPFLYFRF